MGDENARPEEGRVVKGRPGEGQWKQLSRPEKVKGITYQVKSDGEGHYLIEISGNLEGLSRAVRKGVKKAHVKGLSWIIERSAEAYRANREKYTIPEVKLKVDVDSGSREAVKKFSEEYERMLVEDLGKPAREFLQPGKADRALYYGPLGAKASIAVGGAAAALLIYGTGVPPSEWASYVKVLAPLGVAYFSDRVYRAVDATKELASGALKPIASRLRGIAESLGIARGAIEDAQAYVADMSAYAEDIASEIGALNSVYAQLETTRSNIQGAVQASQLYLEELEIEVDNAKKDILGVQKHIQNAKTYVETQISVVDGVITELGTLKAEADARITALDAKISAMQGENAGVQYVNSLGNTVNLPIDANGDGVPDVDHRDDGTIVYQLKNGGTYVYDPNNPQEPPDPSEFVGAAGAHAQATYYNLQGQDSKNIVAILDFEEETYETYQADRASFSSISAGLAAQITSLQNTKDDLTNAKNELVSANTRAASANQNLDKALQKSTAAQVQLNSIYGPDGSGYLADMESQLAEMDTRLRTLDEKQQALAEKLGLTDEKLGTAYANVDGKDAELNQYAGELEGSKGGKVYGVLTSTGRKVVGLLGLGYLASLASDAISAKSRVREMSSLRKGTQEVADLKIGVYAGRA